MPGPTTPLLEAPRWTPAELDEQRAVAISRFRAERLREPLAAYVDALAAAEELFVELLRTTDDLTRVLDVTQPIVQDQRLFLGVRYLAGPPMSADDLETLAETTVAQAQKSPELARRLIESVFVALDRGRFPWLAEQRPPSELERRSAVLASAALVASSQVGTMRRNVGKATQEGRVKAALRELGFREVSTRTARTLAKAPGPGEFCGESLLGDRKADLLVGLWDTRTMPIECKVSNSATNSIKRLNNDAAAKAARWRQQFGEQSVVPTAVLSGVFKLRNLEQAQAAGLTIFWAHDLGPMTAWIARAREV